MKKLFSFLLILFVGFSVYAADPDSLLLASNSSSEPIDKEHCTCKGIPLYGDVMIVSSAADFEVEIVNSARDLYVLSTNSRPEKCGEWRFVTSNPDFTIKLVNSKADFCIEYVSSFPGIP